MAYAFYFLICEKTTDSRVGLPVNIKERIRCLPKEQLCTKRHPDSDVGRGRVVRVNISLVYFIPINILFSKKIQNTN